MKIVVFGATGATGKYLVPLLLKAGHEVTALARSPNKVDQSGGTVRIIEGDARDPATIAKAVAGQDIVMSTFGSRSLKADDIQEVFMKNLVAAMHDAGVQRLIDLSAWGTGDSYASANFFFKIIMATILKANFVDKNKGEAQVIDSDILYTFVRPGRLTNGPAKGNVRASLDGKGLRKSISRRDVVSFMVDQIKDQSWIRKAPLIGY